MNHFQSFFRFDFFKFLLAIFFSFWIFSEIFCLFRINFLFHFHFLFSGRIFTKYFLKKLTAYFPRLFSSGGFTVALRKSCSPFKIFFEVEMQS